MQALFLTEKVLFILVLQYKMIIHGPTRYQVLISLDTLTVEVAVANTGTIVESYNRGLVEAYSKLRVESVYKV